MSNKSVWDNFPVKYCLNQDSRPDRWKQATEEFARVGMDGVKRFAAIPADQPIKSFCLSQYAMLKTFLTKGQGVGLIMEDDVAFQGYAHLGAALKELPTDWDILYLGANITAGVTGAAAHPPVKHSAHLYRVFRAWTTHSVVYSRSMAEYLVQNYRPDTMYDAWLSESVLGSHKAFIVNPMVAYQYPGKSDLWGNDTDYTGAFAEGDKIMSV